MSEHQEQAALIEFCQRFSGRVPELALLFAIPNGGARHIATARKLKAEGVQAGVPDLFLPVPHMPMDGELMSYGLFVEMKTATGVLSVAQQRWSKELERRGYTYYVFRSWVDAARQILRYLDYDPSEFGL